jgi:hypothetical protein
MSPPLLDIADKLSESPTPRSDNKVTMPINGGPPAGQPTGRRQPGGQPKRCFLKRIFLFLKVCCSGLVSLFIDRC